jgi:hypothetical protein
MGRSPYQTSPAQPSHARAPTEREIGPIALRLHLFAVFLRFRRSLQPTRSIRPFSASTGPGRRRRRRRPTPSCILRRRLAPTTEGTAVPPSLHFFSAKLSTRPPNPNSSYCIWLSVCGSDVITSLSVCMYCAC